MPATILLRVALLALLSLQVSASRNAIALNKASLRSCDESFPLAPAPPPNSQDHHRRHLFSWGRDRRLVAIRPGGKSRKYYETGEYYAPLCPDGNRIDIRKLYRCSGQSCWDEEISQCTYECTWSQSEPTPRPTPRPTKMVAPTFPFTMTENPLLLSLKDLADRYRMNAQVRRDIINYLFRKLQDDVEALPFDLELLELTYAGRLPGQPHDLPLNAKVRGPPGLSDLVLDYIQQLIRDNEQEIMDNLKMLDGNGGEAMKNARVVAGTFNMNDVVQGEAPTNSPINPPTPKLESPEKVQSTTVIMPEDTPFAIPWWVWLLAAFVIILCCACCICGVFYRRWTLRREKNIEHRLQINERVENNPRPRRRAPSVAESRATRTKVQQSRNYHHTKRPTARSSHAPRSLAPTRELAIYKKEANVEPKETRIVTRCPIKAFDSGTIVSALSAGFNPGAEYAMVSYDRDPRARDPTYYTDRIPGQIEPEGDKADASLMSDVRSEMEEARREREAKKARAERREKREIRSRAFVPDPHEEILRLDYDHSERTLSEPEGMLSDDLQSTKKKKKKRKKSRRKSHKSKASSSNPIESPMDDSNNAMVPIDNKRDSLDLDYDSPSTLTNHANLPEAEIEKLQEAGIYTYTSKNDDGYDVWEDEEELLPKISEKQEELREQHIFDSFTRKSAIYDIDGVSSCDVTSDS